MTNLADQISRTVTPARGDVPQERPCLRCRTPFPSEGFGERVCRRCKGSTTWRSAVQASPSHGRRR